MYFCQQSLKLQRQNYIMEQSRESNNTTRSFIYERQPHLGIRFLRAIDIFSFIPVPKDETVSTKPSIIGSIIFFSLFLTYIIYDFVQFTINNPLIQQNYRTPLDTGSYQLPNFAIAFMNGSLTNETSTYDNLFTYDWTLLTKSQGAETNESIPYNFVTYQNGTQTNFEEIDWMNEATKKFYYILRTNRQPILASGLLYSSEAATYARVKVSYCNNATTNNSCISNDTLNYLSNFGRFFLFVENLPDTTSVSQESSLNNGNNYLLYNFFVIPGFYKRITINFGVVKTQILPDYFLRWRTETNTRIQIESVFEELSVVNYNNSNNTDAIAFNMQLSPTIVNNRISCSTLLDHVSLWGASWGVLFAAFALFFLSYNRRKFYAKHPRWEKFKEVVKGSNNRINTDEQD